MRENNKDGVAVYLYFPFRYSACCIFFSVVSLQVFAFRQSFHILWYTRPSWLLSPFCRLFYFLSHYPFCAFYTHVPWPYMIVCSSFLSLTPLISFTSANFPRLACVFCYNWGSTSLHWQVLLKECVQVSFSAPRQCLSCSALRLTITHVSFILLPFLSFCFASHILFLTHLLFSYFVPDVILPFPSLLLLHRRASPAHHYLWTSRPLPISSILFPLKEEWNGSFLPIFHSLCSLPVLHVAILPPTPPTCHPCGLPSDSWSEGGSEFSKLFSSCDVLRFFSERATAGDLGEYVHVVWETKKERQLQWGVVFQAVF